MSIWIKNILKTEGYRGLYKGMSIAFCKIIPYQGILFMTNEKLKSVLGYEKHDDRKH
jgi:membrane protein CcdC involved in cytochrome C biogenesis